MNKQQAKKQPQKKSSKKAKGTPRLIASNRKARHDYAILENFEAGLCLQGWEVKSIRAGKAQLKESYIIIKQGEAWLIGAHMTPLESASTHIKTDPTRRRKLLLQRHLLDKLIGAVQTKGLTLVALDLHWKHQYVKMDMALARGKKTHDKRASEKDRDWQRQKQRILSSSR